MRYTLLIFCLFGGFVAFAQEKKNGTADSAHKMHLAERMPKPRFSMRKYLSAHLQYPKEARENHIEGRVVIKFIIDQHGEVDSARVVSGIGHGCDEAALMAVEQMPKWRPGRSNGKRVRVYFQLPVDFRIED
jgi:periplasmic protein TonB